MLQRRADKVGRGDKEQNKQTNKQTNKSKQTNELKTNNTDLFLKLQGQADRVGREDSAPAAFSPDLGDICLKRI